MTEQWQELKETITEMRDNNGTGTQQEVCKFLVNLMEILEKQMQEPSGDLISRQDAIDAIWDGTNMDIYTREVKETLEEIPSVKQEPKTGHWIWCVGSHKCSNCEEYTCFSHKELLRYCPNCGAKMVEPQESEG